MIQYLKYSLGPLLGGAVMITYFNEAFTHSGTSGGIQHLLDDSDKKKKILKRHATMNQYGVDMKHINMLK
jgi:hypothetical protein